MTEGASSRRFLGRITALVPITPEVVCARVELSPNFNWTAGQHLALQVTDGKDIAYYSIASADQRVSGTQPTAAELDLAINASAWRLEKPLNVGLEVVVGPAGGGPDIAQLCAAPAVIMVGIGTGVAPLRAVVQELTKERQKVPNLILVQGARNRQSCLFFDEFLKTPGLEYRPVFSRHSDPDIIEPIRLGRVQAHLLDVAKSDAHYCLCGSLTMVSEVSELLVAQGIPTSQIFSEGY